MNKTFSKFALPLIVLANLSPAFATTEHQNIGSLKQQPAYQANEKYRIAGFFDDIKDTVDDVTDTVEDVDETKHGIRERNQEIEERKAREEERKRAQEEYEAARKAALEREIQEAEKRRAYFESLSPEEKQAYINQQHEARQKEQEAQLFMLGIAADLLFSGGGNSSSSNQSDEYIYYKDSSSPPTYSSGSSSTQRSGGLHGNCHHYDC